MPPAVAKILGGTVDDKGQGNAMMRGPGGAQHAAKETPPDILELLPPLERLNKELADEIKTGKLEVRMEARGLVISLRQSAFFSVRRRHARRRRAAHHEKAGRNCGEPANSIQLEGHTDSIPIHNQRFRSNWELSCARAIAVLETLCGTYQLPRARFSVVGRADTLPVDTNDTPEGRARNRRVDVVIVNSVRASDENPVQIPNSNVKSAPVPQAANSNPKAAPPR